MIKIKLIVGMASLFLFISLGAYGQGQKKDEQLELQEPIISFIQATLTLQFYNLNGNERSYNRILAIKALNKLCKNSEAHKAASPFVKNVLNKFDYSEFSYTEIEEVLAHISFYVPEIIPALIKVFEANKKYDVSLTTARALAHIRLKSKIPEIIPTLIKALNSTQEDSRISAAVALGMIGPEAREAVLPLIAVIETTEEKSVFHEYAKEALNKIAPHDLILSESDAGDTSVPSNPAEMENGTSPEPEGINIPTLIQRLKNRAPPKIISNKSKEEFEATASAVYSFIQECEAAKEVLEKLDPPARESALYALLSELDNEKNSSFRLTLAELLNNMGPQAREVAIPVFIQELNNEDPSIRLDAAGLLTSHPMMGLQAREAALPVLIQELNNKDPSIRLDAAEILGEIDFPKINKTAVLAIIKELDNTTPSIRQQAVEILKGMVSFSEVPTDQREALVQNLESNDPDLQRAAAETLIKITAKEF